MKNVKNIFGTQNNQAIYLIKIQIFLIQNVLITINLELKM